MDNPPTFDEQVEVLARYVYEFKYQMVQFSDRPPMNVFDHEFTSNLELIADILTQLKIVAPIDEHGRHTTFICKPSEFKKTARMYRGDQFSDDMVVVALIALVRQDGPKNSSPLDCLAKLGVCEPVEFKMKPLDLSRGVVIQAADFVVIWTEKKSHYDRQRSLWKEYSS